MVVAHTKGLLKPVKYSDTRALVRENIILQQVQRDILYQLEELKYFREIAQLQLSIADPEGQVLKYHSEQAHNIFMRILSTRIPDRDWKEFLDQTEQKEAEKDVDTWEGMFGKLDDPETQKEIDKAIEWLKTS